MKRNPLAAVILKLVSCYWSKLPVVLIYHRKKMIYSTILFFLMKRPRTFSAFPSIPLILVDIVS